MKSEYNEKSSSSGGYNSDFELDNLTNNNRNVLGNEIKFLKTSNLVHR